MKYYKTFNDYLVYKKELYESEIDFFKECLSRLDHYSIYYNYYKKHISEYEKRLDCINAYLGSVKGKE